MLDAIMEQDETKVQATVETLPTSLPCNATDTCLIVYPDLARAKLQVEATQEFTLRKSRSLGSGLYGDVWLVNAFDKEGKQTATIALKELKATQTRLNQHLEFLTEVVMAGVIGCTAPTSTPTIFSPLLVYATTDTNQHFGAVLEAMDGTLHFMLEDGQFGPGSRVGNTVEFVRQVWTTVKVLQDKLQFEHRDLHTQNVLWKLEGAMATFKLIDFGQSTLRVPGTALQLGSSNYPRIGPVGDLPYLARTILWRTNAPTLGSYAQPLHAVLRQFLLHLCDGLWLAWGPEPSDPRVSNIVFHFRIAARQKAYPHLRYGLPSYGLEKVTELVNFTSGGGELTQDVLDRALPIGLIKPLSFRDQKAGVDWLASLLEALGPTRKLFEREIAKQLFATPVAVVAAAAALTQPTPIDSQEAADRAAIAAATRVLTQTQPTPVEESQERYAAAVTQPSPVQESEDYSAAAAPTQVLTSRFY